GAAGRRAGPAAGRVPRGDHPPAPRRSELPGGGRAHGPHRGQCQEAVGARPCPAPRRARRGNGMNRLSTLSRLTPPPTPSGADDPRVLEALEEYLAALEGGARPDRTAL